MRIASYLVGYDSQGHFCHLVIDNLPLASKTLYGDLRRREIAGRSSNDLDLFVLGSHDGDALCLPQLPVAVIAELTAGRALPVLDLASGSEAQLVCAAESMRVCS